VNENIKALFPADDNPDFWVRCLFKNLTPVPTASRYISIAFGAQFVYWDGMGVYIDSSDDNRLGFVAQGGGLTSGDTSTRLTDEILPTDLVDVMWHYELTNPQSYSSGQGVLYDFDLTVYVRVNDQVIPDERSFSGTMRQMRFDSNSANDLAPMALQMTTRQTGTYVGPSDVEIHGWEIVPSSIHTDPFGVLP
jgi:hypothetical protein